MAIKKHLQEGFEAVTGWVPSQETIKAHLPSTKSVRHYLPNWNRMTTTDKVVFLFAGASSGLALAAGQKIGGAIWAILALLYGGAASSKNFTDADFVEFLEKLRVEHPETHKAMMDLALGRQNKA